MSRDSDCSGEAGETAKLARPEGQLSGAEGNRPTPSVGMTLPKPGDYAAGPPSNPVAPLSDVERHDIYERGIADACIWLRDQQHKNPPGSLWHAASILADRMNVALLPAPKSVSPSPTDPREEMREALDELAQIKAVIADPAAVHLNMLRGSIAKPSLRSLLHLYGEEALATYAAGEKARATLAGDPS